MIVLKPYKSYTRAKPPPCSYPDGLPAPIASGTRIVGRFAVTFR